MKKYEIPTAELVRLSADDIITTSGEAENAFVGDPAEAMPTYWSSRLS